MFLIFFCLFFVKIHGHVQIWSVLNNRETFDGKFYTKDEIKNHPTFKSLSEDCDGQETGRISIFRSVDNPEIYYYFECCTRNCLKKNQILKRVSNSNQRNLPQKWYNKHTGFMCHDPYNRSIVMPIGIQGCFLQPKSEAEYSNIHGLKFNSGHKATVNYGVLDRIHVVETENGNKSCGYSYVWQGQKPYKDVEMIPDGQCVVTLDAKSLLFHCCCIANGKKCDVGIGVKPGFNCPQISTQFTLGKNYQPKSDSETKILDSSAVDLTLECFATIHLTRKTSQPVLDVNFELRKKDTVCQRMFEKYHNNGCRNLQRLFYFDVNTTLVLCCRFNYEDENKGNFGVLKTHQLWMQQYIKKMKILMGETFQQCSRPFRDTTHDICVVYFDYEAHKFMKNNHSFVNVQFGNPDIYEPANFYITDESKQRFEGAIGNKKTGTIFIQGKLNLNLFNGYYEDYYYQKLNLPDYYNITVMVYICKTGNDNKRCDELDEDLKKTLIKKAEEYLDGFLAGKCKTNNATVSKGSWDGYCSISKHLESKNKKPGYDQKVVNRDEDGTLQTLGEKMTGNGQFYCTELIREKNSKKITCICKSNSNQPCNSKKEMDKIWTIEGLSSPQIDVSDYQNKVSKGVCNIPSLGPKFKCLNQVLQGVQPVCIAFKEDQLEQIGCYREPNLSHRIGKKRLEYGMNKHTWHSYLLCKSFDPKTETIRCFVIENLDDENPEKWQNKPQTVCCCRSEHCAEEYEDVQMIKIDDYLTNLDWRDISEV